MIDIPPFNIVKNYFFKLLKRSIQVKTAFTLGGIIAGVLVVHPYVMLIDQLTGAGHGASGTARDVTYGIFAAFSPSMLPMTLAFGLFGGVCGLLIGMLFERNQRLVRYQYQARLHSDLMNSLQQLLGVISHYILNSSVVIGGHAMRLKKKVPHEGEDISAIIQQARKNEEILKIIQDAEFLENIDPCDHTYQKLVELNRRIEDRLEA